MTYQEKIKMLYSNIPILDTKHKRAFEAAIDNLLKNVWHQHLIDSGKTTDRRKKVRICR